MSDDNVGGPGSETYTLLNGLNIDEDEVLGTYRAWITNGQPGTPWIMTARLAGELQWAISGVIPGGYSYDYDDYYYDDYSYAFYDDRTFYPVTVTEYTESTCDIDLYGRKINIMSVKTQRHNLPPEISSSVNRRFWG